MPMIDPDPRLEQQYIQDKIAENIKLRQVLLEAEQRIAELEQKAGLKAKLGFEPPQPNPGIVDEDTVEQERARHEWAKFFSED